MPQSDVGATSQKGLEKKVKYNNATVGRLSDIAERGFIHKEIMVIINVQFMRINGLVHPQE